MDRRFERIEETLIAVARELFEAYGKACTYEGRVTGYSGRTEKESVIATIGFAGTKVRGSLVLVARRVTAEALRPNEIVSIASIGAIGAKTDEGMLGDVLGEFANMLLGRLKNKLLARGVELLLGTPTTALGRELALTPSSETSAWYVFEIDGPNRAVRSPSSGLGESHEDHASRRVHVRLEAEIDPALEVSDGPEVRAFELAEGDMVLF
ncbi:hypothetical protein AKJ09_01048 [Labilithrix luteola]|uniref:Chemotaxis phosphatase CheX-like domain-containing protein n=1 Tax=Labilithrix luteola TaxID=1391654 RepID=A0A0K1PMP6_9BACT|nr:chemotaxis protein CheX [Labilithrix luteola]AKU94384.1 hypothetical protein AKJ09_01048 [Labilithrix luteola]